MISRLSDRVLWIAAIALVGCGTDAAGSGADPDAATDAGSGDVADTSDGSGADAGQPDATDTGVAPESREDGEPCVADEQCAGGTCLLPRDGFPEGYCTALPCDTRRDCTEAAACLRGEFNGDLCVSLCQSDDDCRQGYACANAGTAGYCYPRIDGAALNTTCTSDRLDDMLPSPFDFGADFSHRQVTVDVPEGATSVFFVAWDDNERLAPVTFTFSDGAEIDLEDYAKYFYTPLSFENLSPVLFPGGPQYRDLVKPGPLVIDVAWDGEADDEFCWIFMTDDDVLDVVGADIPIDLNFYFVGVEGLTAATAETDPDFTEVLDELQRVYAQAGIGIGAIRYNDVQGDVAERFTVIRDQDEVYELVKLSRQPGDTLDELLSVNVFFIEGFAGSDMGGVLGISTGIPGAAGLHGSPASGLVFSAAMLGRSSGNQSVGQTLAHEIGHYLGLFHTTEQQNLDRDQLDDTPSCPDIGFGNPSCPDASNLMFPIANFRDDIRLTNGQALIMRANPLTRAEEN